MSQDQEPVGAEPPSQETIEESQQAPMNALEASESEVEEVQEEPEDTSAEKSEEDESQSSSQVRDFEDITDSDEATHPMDLLLEEESYDLEMPRRGEIRVGTIARVTESDVLVDIGAKSEGVISSRELERLTDEQRSEMVVGNQVDVYVLRSGGRDGQLMLSMSKAREERDWQLAESLLKSQDLYEGTVAGYNKGGLIIKLGNVRGFIPASQVSLSRRRRAHGNTPGQRWGKMVDDPVIAKVLEVDRSRNRLIMSERAATREARDALKERLIDDLEIGEARTGHVISLADFGAFVDIGGADGLVHLSEISWKRVSHPREVLKVGQKVDVKVLGVDKERKRISLSIRELEPNPWDQIVENFEEGQLVEGTITKLTDFGAFASLAGTGDYDIEGLIHVSELADHRVEHPREVVQEGQVVSLRIIKIDHNRRRIGLSLKRVSSAEYSEQDWRAAMQEMQARESEDETQGEVEDFDAALEAVTEDIPVAEEDTAAAEDAEAGTTEAEAVETPEVETSEEEEQAAEETAEASDVAEVEAADDAQVEADEAEEEAQAAEETAAASDVAEAEAADEAQVEADEAEEEAQAAEDTAAASDVVEMEAADEAQVEAEDTKTPEIAEPGEEQAQPSSAESQGADTGGDPPSDDPQDEGVDTK
ncbi:MAG: S1 RNA-binding domain-containing protein [Anaerolineales bacterium]